MANYLIKGVSTVNIEVEVNVEADSPEEASFLAVFVGGHKVTEGKIIKKDLMESFVPMEITETK